MVTPIPKINHPTKGGDLRPITILPLPGRVLEKMTNCRMISHLEKKYIYLVEHQNGFRRGKSTTKSLAILIDKLMHNLDQGNFSIILFLDFKKVFY